jgi:CspA family cold shock protein
MDIANIDRLPGRCLTKRVDIDSFRAHIGVRSRFCLFLFLPDQGSSQDNVEFGRKAANVCPARGRHSAFSMEAVMATGTVKFFNSQKGFGFIQPAEGGKDVFVHISAVERSGMSTLNEGQKVSYEVVSERGKLAASNLQAV